MTSSALALPGSGIGTMRQHPLVVRYAPIVTIVMAMVAIWYVAAVLMNLTLVRDGFEREETPLRCRTCSRAP
jgi:NitT/TauT family transport system permease protein